MILTNEEHDFIMAAMESPELNAVSMPGVLNVIEAAAPTVNLSKIEGGVAYSGGAIRQYWLPMPIVVAVDGITMTQQTPLLYNHYNSPSCRLGVADPEKTPDALLVAGGGLHNDTELAREIVSQGKKYDWQLSIGAGIDAYEDVPRDEKRTVNGREFTGPFRLVTKSTLREISIVAVGADSETHLKIAASFSSSFNLKQDNPEGNVVMNKKLKKYIIAKLKLGADSTDEQVMAALQSAGLTIEAMTQEFNTISAVLASDDDEDGEGNGAGSHQINAGNGQSQLTPPAASGTPQSIQASAQGNQPPVNVEDAVKAYLEKQRKDENDRVQAINEACGNDYADLRLVAVNEGWSVEATNHAVTALKKERDSRPKVGGNIIVRAAQEMNAKMLEAALCLRESVSDDFVLKAYGEQTIDAADKIRDISCKDLFRHCLALENKPMDLSFNNQTIQAAFSTVSLPGILNNVANKILLNSYQAYNIIATRFCSSGNLNDFKESERYRMTDIGDLEPVAADGEIKEGGVTEEKATNQAELYAKKFCLTYKMIMNDGLGAFFDIPRNMGNRAARLIDKLFFKRLEANPKDSKGNNLFSAKHKNLLATSDRLTDLALAFEALKFACGLFEKQVDADDEPISVSPKYLLVHPDNKYLARELTMSTPLIMSGGDATASAAPNVRAGLNVLAEDNLVPVSAPYLTDAAAWYLLGDPRQIDTFEIGYFQGRKVPTIEKGDTDFNTLGMWFRVIFGLGVREQDFRGMVKSNGK